MWKKREMGVGGLDQSIKIVNFFYGFDGGRVSHPIHIAILPSLFFDRKRQEVKYRRGVQFSQFKAIFSLFWAILAFLATSYRKFR